MVRRPWSFLRSFSGVHKSKTLFITILRYNLLFCVAIYTDGVEAVVGKLLTPLHESRQGDKTVHEVMFSLPHIHSEKKKKETVLLRMSLVKKYMLLVVLNLDL